MVGTLRVVINSCKPIRGGHDFYWSTILDLTSEKDPLFSQRDIDGRCDVGQTESLGVYLRLLLKAGFLEIASERVNKHQPRVYRLVRRQRETPRLSHEGVVSQKGTAQQRMWNVMRRSRQGFTIAELALAASIDGNIVARSSAKNYCTQLHQAGVLEKLRARTGGKVANCFVLRGSANTGPKAPVRYRTTLIFDPNTSRVLGDVIAEEASS